jgi:hypothetical protein
VLHVREFGTNCQIVRHNHKIRYRLSDCQTQSQNSVQTVRLSDTNTKFGTDCQIVIHNHKIRYRLSDCQTQSQNSVQTVRLSDTNKIRYRLSDCQTQSQNSVQNVRLSDTITKFRAAAIFVTIAFFKEKIYNQFVSTFMANPAKVHFTAPTII